MIIFHANIMRQDIVLETGCQTLSVNGQVMQIKPDL